MSIWLSARFVHPPDEPVQIRMKPDGDELLIQGASAGNVVARWAFTSLYKTDESTPSTYVLRSSAHDASIEIVDLEAMKSLDWLWKLPAQKVKDPRKRLAWTFGSLGFVVIGLVVGASLLLSQLPSSLETLLFRERSVFPETNLCQSDLGSEAFNTVLKPLLELRSGSERLRISFYKSEALESFAFPANRIFISSGFLSQLETPAELAGLIAHQMEHVARAHPLTSFTRDGVFTPYLRLFFSSEKTGALDSSLVQLFARPRLSVKEEKAVHEGAAAQLERANLATNGLATLFGRLRERGEFPGFYTDHHIEELPATPTPPAKTDTLNSDWLALKKICD
jgi:hypothetical protein